MCEKCRERSLRACIALASAVYVAVEDRKQGDALAGLFAGIREAYKGIDWSPGGEEVKSATPESIAVFRQALSKLTAAEMSETLRIVQSFGAALDTAEQAVKSELIQRYVDGERTMHPAHMKAVEEFIARDQAPNIPEALQRAIGRVMESRDGKGGHVFLVVGSPPTGDAEQPIGFGKMPDHVQ